MSNLHDIDHSAVFGATKAARGLKSRGRDPVLSPQALARMRKAERVTTPDHLQRITNASSREPYRAPELKRGAAITDARHRAFTLPSRMNDRLHYPDGTVEPIQP